MRFFFDLVCGEFVLVDEDGVEAADADAVRHEAEAAIRELKLERPEAEWSGCRMRVWDAAGRLHWTGYLAGTSAVLKLPTIGELGLAPPDRSGKRG